MIRPIVLLLLLLPMCIPAQAARTMVAYEQPRDVPEFELPGTDGKVHRLSDYRGRYLLVNFWAIWCSPCRKEMPSMQQVYGQLAGKDFDMVAIHVGPSMEGARTFAETLGLEFSILVDEEMVLNDWQVLGLPTTFLIDRDGRVVAEAVGERDWADGVLVDQLRSFIDSP